MSKVSITEIKCFLGLHRKWTTVIHHGFGLKTELFSTCHNCKQRFSLTGIKIVVPLCTDVCSAISCHSFPCDLRTAGYRRNSSLTEWDCYARKSLLAGYKGLKRTPSRGCGLLSDHEVY